VAFASSLDQIGPIARSVEDLAYILPAISGYDPMDSTSANRPVDRTDVLLGKDVSKMRIALPTAFFGDGLQKEVKEAVLKAAKRYESLGAQVEEVDMPTLKHALPAYYLISSAEASSNLARFDGVQYGYRTESFDSLGDLYKKSRGEGFGREVKRRILLGTYALSSGYYDAYYQKALKVRTLIQSEFRRIFEGFDAVLSPVAPTTAYKFGAHSKNPVEMYLEDIYTVPVNIAGLPGLSVNCGVDSEGLPIGMQLIGRAFDEATLLSLGYAYEQSFMKGGASDGE
jgi:aspartyl-tRNA(Asn)/glutamyl-tRNA(Gln) amidotransferase subunit A